MSSKRVVVIEGEDASPEAMRPSLALLQELGCDIEWIQPAVGERAIAECGNAFPPEARAAIDASDATLFGSTNGVSAPALFHLRWGRGTYANVRPCRFHRGYHSPLARPDGIDFAIVRENLEDLYVCAEGDVSELAGLDVQSLTQRKPVSEIGPGRFALKIITEAGTDQVVRFSFELARKRHAERVASGTRPRPARVTCGTKHNMLPKSDGLFREVAAEIARGYPDVEYQNFIVDDFAHRLIADPHALDVVVLPNLYGDILSDAGAALVGGLGLAPSGCYGDDYAYFESAHGTAPDIAGQNIINPTATLLSGAMMLRHLGFLEAADSVEASIAAVYADGSILTPDQGGSASTPEFCEAVAARITRPRS
jgi:isocitrate/isopropylmalate dehydrogenase